MKQSALTFDTAEGFNPHSLTIAPSVHVQARETSALAAVENLPRRGTQNATLLHLITLAGDVGLSHKEAEQLTGWGRPTLCARYGNLRGFLEVAPTRYEHPKSKRLYTRWRRIVVQKLR